MSIEAAERLKQELTDKYVVVAPGVPELRRFAGLTGTVKTVNMNGRALVQFDHPVDISWYDISPEYLKVVDAPLKKQKPAASAAPAAAKGAAKPAPQPAAAQAGGRKLSPLEMARQQGAAKTAAAAGGTAEKSAPAARPEGRKLSPLELARQQGAAKSGASAPSAAGGPPAAASTAGPVPSASPEGKKLSPLELARQQGAAKGDKPAAKSEAPAEPAAEPERRPVENGTDDNGQPAEQAREEKPATLVGPDGKPLSKIELARRQGAFKG